MKNDNKLSHSELVELAVKWLYSHGCGFAVGELSCLTHTGEIPDAIGFKNNQSVLIECKTSMADFIADKKKPFRQCPKDGMGNLRLFLCEEGVIKPEHLPDKWGLLYVVGRKVKKVVFPKGNVTYGDFWQEKNHESEYSLMYSCLRRKIGIKNEN